MGLAIAFTVNRYTADKYDIKATVAVEETDNPLASAGGLLDLGLSFGGTGIVDTRTAVLKSYAHNARVARSLGWGVKYFNEGRLNRREVYQPEHFSVVFDEAHDQLLGAEWSVDFSEEDFDIEFKIIEPLTVYNFSSGSLIKKLKWTLLKKFPQVLPTVNGLSPRCLGLKSSKETISKDLLRSRRKLPQRLDFSLTMTLRIGQWKPFYRKQ